MFKNLAVACSAAALSLGIAAQGAQAEMEETHMGHVVIIDVVSEQDCLAAVEEFRTEVRDTAGSAEALIEADAAMDACNAGEFREAANHLTDAYQEHYDNVGMAPGGN